MRSGLSRWCSTPLKARNAPARGRFRPRSAAIPNSPTSRRAMPKRCANGASAPGGGEHGGYQLKERACRLHILGPALASRPGARGIGLRPRPDLQMVDAVGLRHCREGAGARAPGAGSYPRLEPRYFLWLALKSWARGAMALDRRERWGFGRPVDMDRPGPAAPTTRAREPALKC